MPASFLSIVTDTKNLSWIIKIVQLRGSLFVSTSQYQKAMHHHHILMQTASCSLHAVNHLKCKLLYLVLLHCWAAGCWCPFVNAFLIGV